MPFSLLPGVIAKCVTDILPENTAAWGVRLLMLDFDNTLVPYTTDVPTPELLSWLEKMKAANLSLCVVSNSKKERVKAFCRKYEIDCITHAKKPGGKGIRQCLEQYKLPPEVCALVGDQIYTDVLGANLCGVKSILVQSIDNHNFWLKARHVLELPFIAIAKKRSENL